MSVIDTLAHDRDTLVRELAGIGIVVRGNSCRCCNPEHDDTHPSAALYEKDGHWRLKCHGCGWCGDVYDVRAMLAGKQLREVLAGERGNMRPAPPPPKPKPSIDWQARHDAGRRQLDPGELHDFADAELGLSGEGVDALAPTLVDGRYAFPERDAGGRIIGLVKRGIDGMNLASRGCNRGLTYQHPLSPIDPVLIVEGASDTAAAIEAGYTAVGRPSNRGGGELLAQLLRGRDVIVAGENDRKPDGRWPGREGVEVIADRLRPVCKSVRILYPPEGVKDIRCWLAQGSEA